MNRERETTKHNEMSQIGQPFAVVGEVVRGQRGIVETKIPLNMMDEMKNGPAKLMARHRADGIAKLGRCYFGLYEHLWKWYFCEIETQDYARRIDNPQKKGGRERERTERI